jgi:hypothetical protein
MPDKKNKKWEAANLLAAKFGSSRNYLEACKI